MRPHRTYPLQPVLLGFVLAVVSALVPSIGRTEAPLSASPAPPRPLPAHQAAPQPLPVRTPDSPLLTGPSRFGVGLGMSREWRSDRGYERFGGQAHTMFRLVASADAWRLGRLALAGEASFETDYEDSSDTVLGDTNLRTDSIAGAFVPRFALSPWLLVHGRVGAGAVLSKLQLSPTSIEARTERDWGYVFDLGAGVSLAVPEGSMRTTSGKLGTLMPLLRVEAGYRFAADAKLGPRGGATDDGGELPVNLSSLGTLKRSAAFVRVVGMVRF